jgi:hypothetical protein
MNIASVRVLGALEDGERNRTRSYFSAGLYVIARDISDAVPEHA